MINKISLFFQRIDRMVFEQIDLFKKTSFYEEILDKIETVSQGQGKVFIQILSGVLILLPLVVTLIFWLGNIDLKNSLEVKKEISQTIYDYKRKNSISEPLKSKGISRNPLRTKEDFVNVMNALSSKKQNFQIEKITFKKISKKMGRSRVMLKFNNLTTGALFETMGGLIAQHKARVSHVRIRKDKILKTLKGEMELVFYSVIRSVSKDK